MCVPCVCSATRRRSPLLERQQAAARLGLYGHLRRMDPEAFRRLLSRSDLRVGGAGRGWWAGAVREVVGRRREAAGGEELGARAMGTGALPWHAHAPGLHVCPVSCCAPSPHPHFLN
mgnify:CR=1 FL=1